VKRGLTSRATQVGCKMSSVAPWRWCEACVSGRRARADALVLCKCEGEGEGEGEGGGEGEGEREREMRKTMTKRTTVKKQKKITSDERRASSVQRPASCNLGTHNPQRPMGCWDVARSRPSRVAGEIQHRKNSTLHRFRWEIVPPEYLWIPHVYGRRTLCIVQVHARLV